jgi:hypothetical protein
MRAKVALAALKNDKQQRRHNMFTTRQTAAQTSTIAHQGRKVSLMRPALLGTALALLLAGGPALAQPFEYGKDRHGSDIEGADFELKREGNPIDCQNACIANSTCRAWTFLRSYYFENRPNPSCKLKSGVPRATDDFRTVSGVREDFSPATWYREHPPGSSTGQVKLIEQRGLAQEIVQAHNKYRTEVGVPPIQWSTDLANHAQEWANYLSANLLFQHSGATGEGENLWAGSSHTYSFTQMIDAFGNEKKDFIYGVFPNVSRTGNWVDVGHYTQLVWRNTTHVGCAGADGNDGTYRLVCRYGSPGNVVTQVPY